MPQVVCKCGHEYFMTHRRTCPRCATDFAPEHARKKEIFWKTKGLCNISAPSAVFLGEMLEFDFDVDPN